MKAKLNRLFTAGMILFVAAAMVLSGCKKQNDEPEPQPEPQPQPTQNLNGNVSRPVWEAPSIYDYTSSMTVTLKVDLLAQYPEGAKDFELKNEDLVAAFVGETCLGTVTMPNAVPSRAMLATEDAQSIRVSISNSAPTGLGHIKNGTSESELPAYDLQGRRVGKGWKGIYIQRGRKEIKLGNGLK